jgi:hypothetical protein
MSFPPDQGQIVDELVLDKYDPVLDVPAAVVTDGRTE